jgi:hypothetical protein
MRTRKAKGKKPAVITLTESDILDICHKHLKAEGYDIGKRIMMRIPLKTAEKKRQKLEIMFEMERIPEKIKPTHRSIYSKWEATDEGEAS